MEVDKEKQKLHAYNINTFYFMIKIAIFNSILKRYLLLCLL